MSYEMLQPAACATGRLTLAFSNQTEIPSCPPLSFEPGVRFDIQLEKSALTGGSLQTFGFIKGCETVAVAPHTCLPALKPRVTDSVCF